MDLRKQFLTLLENSQIKGLIISSAHNLSLDTDYNSIKSGFDYMKLSKSPYDLTCTFNIDGVPVFNSSNSSLWPVQISINELPFRVRKKNILLAGIWFGQSKPNMKLFLPAVIDEMNSLSKVPLIWSSHEGIRIVSKVFFPLCSVDSVARCMLQGHTQFNGKYGCNWCRNPGKTIPQGKGHCRAYLPSSTSYKERTPESYRRLAETGKFKKGIKFYSPLLNLEQFDIVNGFSVDCMHCVFLGVIRSLTNKWLKGIGKAWSIGMHIDKIDEILCRFKSPSEVVRTCRSIMARTHWKASEWRTWLFLVPVILKNILSEPYLAHISCLSRAIFISSKQSFTSIELDESENCILQFLRDGLALYGETFYSFNVHQLEHLSNTVRRWGPLWNSSAFQFESFNGKLLNYVKSATGVLCQVCEKFANELQVNNLLTKTSNNICFGVKSGALQKNLHEIKNPKSVASCNFFENMIPQGHTFFSLSKSKRAIINYYSFSTKFTSKRCDNLIFLRAGVLGRMQAFFKVTSRLDEIISENYFVQVSSFKVTELVGLPHIYKCKRNVKSTFEIMNFNEIVPRKYFSCVINNEYFYIEVPNLFEVD